MGAATTGCRLVALCALVPFVCGDDATTCAEATTPWAPTGCGIKDLQGIVVDGTHADRGMPPHPFLKGEKIDSLYSYLKGRSDGKIAPGKVTPME